MTITEICFAFIIIFSTNLACAQVIWDEFKRSKKRYGKISRIILIIPPSAILFGTGAILYELIIILYNYLKKYINGET